MGFPDYYETVVRVVRLPVVIRDQSRIRNRTI